LKRFDAHLLIATEADGYAIFKHEKLMSLLNATFNKHAQLKRKVKVKYIFSCIFC